MEWLSSFVDQNLQTAIVNPLVATMEILEQHGEGGKPFMAELATIQIVDSYNIDIEDNS